MAVSCVCGENSILFIWKGRVDEVSSGLLGSSRGTQQVHVPSCVARNIDIN